MATKVYKVASIRNTLSGVAICLFITPFFASGCASSSAVVQQIIVEGEVWKRGNEPFAEYVLTTDQQNHYVLRWDGPAGASMGTPVRARVLGSVYLDEWNGEPHAFLRVASMEVLE